MTSGLPILQTQWDLTLPERVIDGLGVVAARSFKRADCAVWLCGVGCEGCEQRRDAPTTRAA